MKISKPFRGIIVAVPGYGKSVMLRYIFTKLVQAKIFSTLFVFSSSVEDWRFLSSTNKLIKTGYSNSVVERIFEHQEVRFKKRESEIEKFGKSNTIVKDILIVIDDIDVSEDDPRYSDVLKKIYSTGRHYGISVLVACQYFTQLNRQMRQNSNYLFIGAIKPDQSRSLFGTQSYFRTVSAFDEYINANAVDNKFVCFSMQNTRSTCEIIKAPNLKITLKCNLKDNCISKNE